MPETFLRVFARQLRHLFKVWLGCSEYTLAIPTLDGYTLTAVTGNEDYQGTVEGYVTVKATYKKIVDGITNAEISTQIGKQGIYDLQGRRVQRVARPGIYIVNGQKTLVK